MSFGELETRMRGRHPPMTRRQRPRDLVIFLVLGLALIGCGIKRIIPIIVEHGTLSSAIFGYALLFVGGAFAWNAIHGFRLLREQPLPGVTDPDAESPLPKAQLQRPRNLKS